MADTFFQIPIFEKGYEKDPAIVAKEAIQEACRNKSDVVLVDTAGRMQVSTCPNMSWRYFLIFMTFYMGFFAVVLNSAINRF